MNEITLSELSVDTYFLQLKRYDSLNNSTIYDYYPAQDDSELQYLQESVLEPFINNPDAKSSILYFLYQPLYSGKSIFFAKNENFPIEPFASKYGSSFGVATFAPTTYYSSIVDRPVSQERFEKFILSPIEDFTPPTPRKQIVYDFKFTSKGDVDNIAAQISTGEFGSSSPESTAETFSPATAPILTTGATVSFGSGGTSGGSSGGY